MHRLRCGSLLALALGVFTGVSTGCEQKAQPWMPHIDGGALADGAVDAEPFVCAVTPPTVCPDPPPRYPDVQPIFEERCVPCHFGGPGGPWPLRRYQEAADWFDIIRDHMLACTMPPVEYWPLLPMTKEERVAILTWILCGLPQ